jgi:hypothetical protein
VVGTAVARLRATALDKIQRPFFAMCLALEGGETVGEIAARFAELRAQLNLPANRDADFLLAVEQRGGVTYH